MQYVDVMVNRNRTVFVLEKFNFPNGKGKKKLNKLFSLCKFFSFGLLNFSLFEI